VLHHSLFYLFALVYAADEHLPFPEIRVVNDFESSSFAIDERRYLGNAASPERGLVDDSSKRIELPAAPIEANVSEIVRGAFSNELISLELAGQNHWKRPLEGLISENQIGVYYESWGSSSIYSGNVYCKIHGCKGDLRSEKCAFSGLEQVQALVRDGSSARGAPSSPSRRDQSQNYRNEPAPSPDQSLCADGICIPRSAVGFGSEVVGPPGSQDGPPLRTEIRYLTILWLATIGLIWWGAFLLPYRTRPSVGGGLLMICGGLACFGWMMSL
jgi:hypothetical protein